MRANWIVVGIALAGFALAQTGGQKTQSNLNAEINSNIPSGVAGAVTAANVRQALLDMVATVPNVADPYAYSAAGVTTATTGSVNASSASLVVASATGWTAGMGIAIAGAGAAGAELVTVVDAISGTTFTLHVAATTMVSGAAVNHDDTAAINSALSSGRPVHLAKGTYNVTCGAADAFTIASPASVIGDGSAFSVIQSRCLAHNIFAISYATGDLLSSALFRDFSIVQSGTPTAGAAFLVGNASTITENVRISDISMTGVFVGIETVNKENANFFHNIAITNAVSSGVWLNAPNPSGDNLWTGIYINATPIGVRITQADTQMFSNVKIEAGANGIKFDASSAVNVQDVKFVGLHIEDTTTCGLDLGSNGAQLITVIGRIRVSAGSQVCNLAAGGLTQAFFEGDSAFFGQKGLPTTPPSGVGGNGICADSLGYFYQKATCP